MLQVFSFLQKLKDTFWWVVHTANDFKTWMNVLWQQLRDGDTLSQKPLHTNGGKVFWGDS